jgi:hypothetical protein
MEVRLEDYLKFAEEINSDGITRKEKQHYVKKHENLTSLLDRVRLAGVHDIRVHEY